MCSLKHRDYGVGICSKCGKQINLEGNLHSICPECLYSIRNPKCVDCGISLSNISKTRCNSCAAKERFRIGTYSGKGRKKYEYNSTRYRRAHGK